MTDDQDYPHLSKTTEWIRDRLNMALGWAVAASMIQAGWALSHGSKIGFRVQDDGKGKLDWIVKEWTDLWNHDQPAAAILWLVFMVVGLSLWWREVERLQAHLPDGGHPTLRRHRQILAFQYQLVAGNFCLWLLVSFF